MGRPTGVMVRRASQRIGSAHAAAVLMDIL
jgi:hypothetical protein